jgi:hypothetical protein
MRNVRCIPFEAVGVIVGGCASIAVGLIQIVGSLKTPCFLSASLGHCTPTHTLTHNARIQSTNTMKLQVVSRSGRSLIAALQLPAGATASDLMQAIAAQRRCCSAGEQGNLLICRVVSSREFPVSDSTPLSNHLAFTSHSLAHTISLSLSSLLLRLHSSAQVSDLSATPDGDR